MMSRLIAITAVSALLAGCVTSSDPADGGFANGVAGLSSGDYQKRVDEREAKVAAEQDRNKKLNQEIAALRSEHQTLAAKIRQQKSRLDRNGVPLNRSTQARVNAALATPNQGKSTDATARSLKRAIAEAKDLSKVLEGLAA